MTVFNSYAKYYDLLYRDKDYHGESDFIKKLLSQHSPSCTSILELGCGTGAHAAILADNGYRVFGVDFSKDMLMRAESRKASLPAEVADRLTFAQGDVRSVRIEESFDAVISLFHVMSYQITNEDFSSALTTAYYHLKPGGVFIFDGWYGPAVLTDRPVVRIKRMDDQVVSITRIAEPVLHPNSNIVDVNYDVFIKDKQTGQVNELHETHRMRYFFMPEVMSFGNQAGFKFVSAAEWLTSREPNFSTWGVYWIFSKPNT